MAQTVGWRWMTIAAVVIVMTLLPRLQRGDVEAWRTAVPMAWAVLDGFEDDPWPDSGLWTLPPDSVPMWWPSTCRPRSGRRSLWAFGGPTARGELQCTYSAPQGTANTMVMNLDLRDTLLATRLELYFALWLDMPPGEDGGLYIHLLVPNAGGGIDRVPIFGATGTSGQWAFPARRLDLLALTDVQSPDRVYDLRGSRWRLEWTALAPNGTPPGGGIFIDDVILFWEPDPAVPTPTLRPTLTPSLTPSATPTATSTATPRGTATPTPWQGPPFGTTYLPILHHELPPLPTATAGVTEPTGTVSPTGMVLNATALVVATPLPTGSRLVETKVDLPVAARSVDMWPSLGAAWPNGRGTLE